jgi:hypothetical protein
MTSPSKSSPASSVTPTGNLELDALLGGSKWIGTGAITQVSYSFPWANGANATFSGPPGRSYSPNGEASASAHFSLNANQQAAAVAAMQSWASVANVQFVQVTETSTNIDFLHKSH